MKRIWSLFAVLALLCALTIPALAAAKVPDEDNIIDRTMDSESPYYYPALMLRYNAGDATLTDEDYHYLYYGYAYQDDYKPLGMAHSVAKAANNMAEQPEAAGQIRTSMMMGLVFIETVIIYALIIANLIIFVL